MNVNDIEWPEGFLTPLTARYKFFPTKEAYENGKGGKIKTAHTSAIHTFLDKDFVEEHGLETVGDIIDLLNSWGYSEGFFSKMSDFGFRFNMSAFEWYHRDSDYLSYKIVKLSPYGDSPQASCFSEVKKYTYATHDFWYNDAMFDIYYKVERCLNLDLPKWLTEINRYNWQPNEGDVKFHGGGYKSELYFGVEIEVATCMNPSDLQYIVTQVEPKQEPFFYFKHDGSIDVKGKFRTRLEIVTFPCSYRYLRKNLRSFFMKLEKAIPDWRDYFYVGPGCGIHIHVSLDSFIDSLHHKKFVSVWNQFDMTNKDFIQKLGKRQFTKYCQTHPDFDGRTVARRLRTSAYGTSGANKYASCRDTVKTSEVRIFKGGFELDHILYCTEVVKAVHDFSYKMPVSLIGSRRFVPEFSFWLDTQPNYSTLKKEMKACA